jgi:NAD(P)-dependent dehydrogenase (short-subunit alcohol dehydrogenase family)
MARLSALFDLSGKTAIITGSSKGIGKAIAHRLAEHGANVVISSRKLDACEAAAEEINADLGRTAAIAVAANIAVKSDLERLVEETRAAFGPIHICICNAASNPYFGPMSGISDEQFTKILQNNIISNHWLISMVAPDMRARKDGAVIVISSIGGLQGSDMIGAYNISKAADMQLARNLALEFGGDNVRVNTIAPGLVKTDFARALWENPEILKQATSHSCLKRIGQPDEIAGMAVFLASPAGAFTTGQTFVIDGGATVI